MKSHLVDFCLYAQTREHTKIELIVSYVYHTCKWKHWIFFVCSYFIIIIIVVAIITLGG